MGFCEENIFRDVTWPKIFNGGVAVRRCPNGTVGKFCLLPFASIARDFWLAYKK